mmetsp:Transcript_74273/g.198143  ORF Transcript_74273/g.198143 Transcript_74273/m.198143 type:complete len:239 (+) Transcript_74273:424-1140(+)
MTASKTSCSSPVEELTTSKVDLRCSTACITSSIPPAGHSAKAATSATRSWATARQICNTNFISQFWNARTTTCSSVWSPGMIAASAPAIHHGAGTSQTGPKPFFAPRGVFTAFTCVPPSSAGLKSDADADETSSQAGQRLGWASAPSNMRRADVRTPHIESSPLPAQTLLPSAISAATILSNAEPSTASNSAPQVSNPSISNHRCTWSGVHSSSTAGSSFSMACTDKLWLRSSGKYST